MFQIKQNVKITIRSRNNLFLVTDLSFFDFQFLMLFTLQSQVLMKTYLYGPLIILLLNILICYLRYYFEQEYRYLFTKLDQVSVGYEFRIFNKY